jgi:hypothetical protein
VRAGGCSERDRVGARAAGRPARRFTALFHSGAAKQFHSRQRRPRALATSHLSIGIRGESRLDSYACISATVSRDWKAAATQPVTRGRALGLTSNAISTKNLACAVWAGLTGISQSTRPASSRAKSSLRTRRSGKTTNLHYI